MPQLRQDLVTGRWVAIATERAKRPSSFTRATSVAVPAAAQCPFCVGHEGMTPPEVMAYRDPATAPNTPGWELRVVPNLYPAFGPATGEANRHTEGLYTVQNGLGVHEVIISSPSHHDDLADLPVDVIARVVRAYVDRYTTHQENPALGYVLIINNHGKEAGASLEHPHSQLFGIPITPPVVQEEIDGLRRYREAQGRCAYCDIVNFESRSGERTIFENNGFLVYAPYASRTPFEAAIIPRRHEPRFERSGPDEQRQFAEAIHELAARISRGLNDPPFNFFVHTAPRQASDVEGYHWHLELLPKLAIAAGFELGTGIMINVATPESAADFLRGVELGEGADTAVTPGLH